MPDKLGWDNNFGNNPAPQPWKAAAAHQAEADRIRWRGIAESCSISILQRLLANYDTDRDHIGDSDLDNEQSIAITFRGTLGDIRNARKALQCFSALRAATAIQTAEREG